MSDSTTPSARLEKANAVSFAGCGALNFYQSGVGYGLQKLGVSPAMTYAGASAGAGLAFTMAAGLDARQVAATMVDWMTELGVGRALKPSWAHQVGERFGNFFVTDETFDIAKGRLVVSITQVSPFANLCVREFDTPQDLRDALTASCFLPYPGQPTVQFRGRPCIDGGFTNNQPPAHSRTLRVSPFWFQIRSTIRATFRIQPHHALRVLSEAQAWTLFNAGYRDLCRWAEGGEASLPLQRARRAAQQLIQGTAPARFVSGILKSRNPASAIS